MNKWRYFGMLLLVASAVIACALIAYASSMVASGQPTWWEHVDLMEVLIGGLISLVLWFTSRTLRKIDANLNKIFAAIDALCRDFYQLKGEHEAMKAKCGVLKG